MVGTSVTKTAQMLGVSRGIVSKVKIASVKEKKTSSAKHKSGWKSKLSVRDRQTLHQIVRKDRRITMLKIISNLKECLQNQMFTKTVHREFHKGTLYERNAVWKPLFSQCLEWYMAHWIWSLQQWKSDFLWRIILFLISNNWLSLCMETAKRSISSKLLSANRETWQGFCENQGCYLFEISRANDFPETIWKFWVTKFTL